MHAISTKIKLHSSVYHHCPPASALEQILSSNLPKPHISHLTRGKTKIFMSNWTPSPAQCWHREFTDTRRSFSSYSSSHIRTSSSGIPPPVQSLLYVIPFCTMLWTSLHSAWEKMKLQHVAKGKLHRKQGHSLTRGIIAEDGDRNDAGSKRGCILPKQRSFNLYRMIMKQKSRNEELSFQEDKDNQSRLLGPSWIIQIHHKQPSILLPIEPACK